MNQQLRFYSAKENFHGNLLISPLLALYDYTRLCSTTMNALMIFSQWSLVNGLFDNYLLLLCWFKNVSFDIFNFINNKMCSIWPKFDYIFLSVCYVNKQIDIGDYPWVQVHIHIYTQTCTLTQMTTMPSDWCSLVSVSLSFLPWCCHVILPYQTGSVKPVSSTQVKQDPCCIPPSFLKKTDLIFMLLKCKTYFLCILNWRKKSAVFTLLCNTKDEIFSYQKAVHVPLISSLSKIIMSASLKTVFKSIHIFKCIEYILKEAKQIKYKKWKTSMWFHLHQMLLTLTKIPGCAFRHFLLVKG